MLVQFAIATDYTNTYVKEHFKLANNTWRHFEYFSFNSDNVNAAFEAFKTLIGVSDVIALNDG
jgi:hypothetical protein